MKELYDYLVKNKVSPNGLFVLHCTFHGYMYPNYVNFRTEQYYLYRNGFLKEEDTGVNKIYKMTDQGLAVLREAENILTKMKRAKKQAVPLEEWEDKIVAYNEMFPKGYKPGTKYSFRTQPKELFERFVWFFKEYPEYNWDLVLEATRKYIRSFEESGDFTYLQQSKYFIKKEDRNKNVTSALATMCYNIAEGNEEEVATGFHYFGP